MESKEAKLIVLGAQGVGKTSLVWRYVKHKFSEHMESTIGASYFPHRLILEDKIVNFQIWDTAGQERFKSMGSIYYRNANAALIVFDITSSESFISSKSWLKELCRCIHDPVIICLVGNKSDLHQQRQVSQEEANEFASSINADYLETSALSNTGIEQVFLNVALKLVKDKDKHLMQNNSHAITPEVDSFNLPLNGNKDSLDCEQTKQQRSCCF